MSFDVKYRLPAGPQPSNDGTGYVLHQLQAVVRPAGSAEAFTPLPGYQRGIYVAAAELQTVLDLDHGPTKVEAYKDLLVSSAAARPEFPTRSWTKAGIQAYAEANALSATQANRAIAYILTVAGSFPIDFDL